MPSLLDPVWPPVLLGLVRSISFFNTICLLWLGLTVLLNVEHRRLGSWLAGGGLLFGALFFAAHSALVGQEPGTYNAEIKLLWPLIWWLLIGAPYLWLLVMTWYAGQLRTGVVGPWYLMLGTIGFLGLAVALVAEPPLRASQVLDPASLDPGKPGLILYAYLGYSIFCIGSSLLVLQGPGQSDRLMGELARRRARPWLAAASVALLLVSLSITGFTSWFLLHPWRESSESLSAAVLQGLLTFDLLVSGQIAIAVVLVGQAIGSYELFTGRVLPRQGLLRHWRRTLILGIGYSAVVAGSVALSIHPTYQGLLSILLLTFFHALLSWRSFLERDRIMAQLRPFVLGQRLHEHPLEPDAPTTDTAAPFQALCEDMLRTRYACLLPLGAMTSFVPHQLIYPADASLPDGVLPTTDWKPSFTCVALEDREYGDAEWAVPLWGHGGLIGVLLIGSKRDGGLYTQEEIEVARATGERLMDELAAAELSQRLIHLQRHRLAERQVLDQRTRRVLHDDVLPLLQTAILRLNAASPNNPDEATDATAILTDVHRQIAGLLRELPSPFSGEIERWGLLQALRRGVESELGSDFEEITWAFDEGATQADKALPSLSSEVLFAAAREVARNAAHHGRVTGSECPLRLHISATCRDGLELTVSDNGVGVRDNGSQNGQGLELYSAMLAVIGGSLTVQNMGEGTKVILRVPMQ